MIAYIQYQFKNYLRSYQFIPPMMIFVIWIFLQYLYNEQPILSSYASSCLGLFIITCWLTLNILNLESLNEKYLLFIQLESKLKYLIAKWLFIFLINCVLIVFSIIYALLLGSFKNQISFKQGVLAILLHLIVCMICILISTLIKNLNVISKKYMWLLISLIGVVSILRPILIQSYPFIKYILWLIPPIGDLIKLYHSDNPNYDVLLLLTLWTLIYIIILFILNLIIFSKLDQKQTS